MRFPPQFRRSAVDQAIQRLRDGRPGEYAYGHRVALILTIPTFDDPVARDIRRSTSGELYVVRTVWNRALDMASWPLLRSARAGIARVPSPEPALMAFPGPSLRSTQVRVDPQTLDALLETVVSTTLCCRPHHDESPLDATIFEVTFGEELHETRFRWSGAAPRGWEPLARFASELVRLVDEPSLVSAR